MCLGPLKKILEPVLTFFNTVGSRTSVGLVSDPADAAISQSPPPLGLQGHIDPLPAPQTFKPRLHFSSRSPPPPLQQKVQGSVGTTDRGGEGKVVREGQEGPAKQGDRVVRGQGAPPRMEGNDSWGKGDASYALQARRGRGRVRVLAVG